MEEKLQKILQSQSWVSATRIAEIGKWRSTANVLICLQKMEKEGKITKRKSPTKRTIIDNTPVDEWTLTSKAKAKEAFEAKDSASREAKAVAKNVNDDKEKKPSYHPDEVSFDPAKRALSIAVRNHNLIDEICTAVGFPDDKPLDQLSAWISEKITQPSPSIPTDKICCNAARVVAGTAGDEVRRLLDLINEKDQRISDLEAVSDSLRRNVQLISDSGKLALSQLNAWREMAGMYGFDTPLDLAGYIGELKMRTEKSEPKDKATTIKIDQRKSSRLPFSVTGIIGFRNDSEKGRVTVFLDRKIDASSITVNREQLDEVARYCNG